MIKQSGAEIIRLWVSMVDYREDIRLGKEILARTVEAYRKFRNVIRVLVANLYDFNPATDAVPNADLLEIDRWVLAKYAECAEKIVTAYDDYDYPGIFQAANTFITNDLSAFYVDVTKDRMYTFGAASVARRSGQTAMFTVVDGLARLLAPILSVTMDELWRALPGERVPSVHMALFPMGDEVTAHRDPDAAGTLGAPGDRPQPGEPRARTEAAGAAHQGQPLGARAHRGLAATMPRCSAEYQDFLPTLFGVSQVELAAGGTEAGRLRPGTPIVHVEKADGIKCERCWRFVPEVSADPAVAGLCSALRRGAGAGGPALMRMLRERRLELAHRPGRGRAGSDHQDAGAERPGAAR